MLSKCLQLKNWCWWKFFRVLIIFVINFLKWNWIRQMMYQWRLMTNFDHLCDRHKYLRCRSIRCLYYKMTSKNHFAMKTTRFFHWLKFFSMRIKLCYHFHVLYANRKYDRWKFSLLNRDCDVVDSKRCQSSHFRLRFLKKFLTNFSLTFFVEKNKSKSNFENKRKWKIFYNQFHRKNHWNRIERKNVRCRIRVNFLNWKNHYFRFLKFKIVEFDFLVEFF